MSKNVIRYLHGACTFFRLVKCVFPAFSGLLLLVFTNRIFFSYSITSKPSVYCFYCLVEAIGVEPMTFCVQGRRSSQLS